MVKVTILEQDKDFLIKEVIYKKAYFNKKFRDKIEIIAYVKDKHRDFSFNEEMNQLKDNII